MKRTRKPLNAPREPRDLPAWLENDVEVAKRQPPLLRLEAAGHLTQRHVEAGELFARRWRLAVEHAPTLTTRYGIGGSPEVDELQQDEARRWLRGALKRMGPTAALIVDLAVFDRPVIGTRLDQSATLARVRAALEKV